MDLPSREIAESEVEDLPLADEIVEGAEALLERGHFVEAVKIIEIDSIRFKAPEARFHGVSKVIPRAPSFVRPFACGEIPLGRKEDFITFVPNELAEDLFGGSLRVDIGRIKMKDPGFASATIERRRGLAIGFTAEAHRPKRESRTSYARLAYEFCLHDAIMRSLGKRRISPQAGSILGISAGMIPLIHPLISEEAIARVGEILRSGMLVQGEEVRAFEESLAQFVGRKHAIAVSSGTAALELALRAAELPPSSEVLIPGLSWPSPANITLALGLKPRFVDVDPAEWNARSAAFKDARSDRTSAAIVIDQFGSPVRQRELRETLDGLFIIEDAACAIGSRGDEAMAGGFGRISCLSFHPRKILTTGEGGACLTDDDALAERLRALRNHGQREPGEFILASGNYRLTEFAAVLGRAQLPRLSEEIEARRAIHERYQRALAGAFAFQRPPPESACNHQTLGLLLPEGCARERVLNELRESGIMCTRLSYALHRIPTLGKHPRLPNAEEIEARGIAIPCHGGLSARDVEFIVERLLRAASATS